MNSSKLLFSYQVVSKSLWPHEFSDTLKWSYSMTSSMPGFAQIHVHWVDDTEYRINTQKLRTFLYVNNEQTDGN